MICIVIINAGFGFYQEYKAQQTVQLLKKYIVGRITLTRNKQQVEICAN